MWTDPDLWMKFIVEMTKALAWPMLIGACAYQYRVQVGLVVRAFARSLRAGRLTKMGPLEWAQIAPAVEAATEVAEAQLDNIKGAVASATEDEKPAKVEQLVDAAKTVEVLKSVYRSLQATQPPVDELPRSLVSMSKLLAQRGIDLAVEKIGRREILNSSTDDQIIVLSEKFRKVMTDDMPEGIRSAIVRTGAATLNGDLTQRGIDLLKVTALRNKNQRD